MDFERKSVFVILGLTFMVIFSLLNFNQLKYKAQISQVLKDIEVITTVDQAKLEFENGEVRDVSSDDLRKMQESLKAIKAFSHISNKISRFAPLGVVQVVFTDQKDMTYTMELMRFDDEILSADLPVDFFENKSYLAVIKYNGIIVKLHDGFLEYAIENKLIQPSQ